eukprot:TRINITY_DN31435_c0_g1_i1.p2 TRINITY_DN31435_c0_g1~~TRINITY_DN31435_c0_g1_i1.p2  ORF type:complete len:111 (+),score=0.41 TRINITY_DN31435_c0_g1_i1:2-334(+)
MTKRDNLQKTFDNKKTKDIKKYTILRKLQQHSIKQIAIQHGQFYQNTSNFEERSPSKPKKGIRAIAPIVLLTNLNQDKYYILSNPQSPYLRFTYIDVAGCDKVAFLRNKF